MVSGPITPAGPWVVGVRLTAAACGHGLAPAQPEKLQWRARQESAAPCLLFEPWLRPDGYLPSRGRGAFVLGREPLEQPGDIAEQLGKLTCAGRRDVAVERVVAEAACPIEAAQACPLGVAEEFGGRSPPGDDQAGW